ncbi:MAG TPA: DNA polymerase III subunit delta' [Burkholderiaceae bacterium]|nr:DNA polymerase III subunit delta' [Burkholderiaceae bacterium]
MAGGEPKAVGLTDGAQLPLPWLREPLAQALRLDRSHALLVHAAQDMGQFELALVLAQARLCEQGARAPCGRCNACRLVRQRTHPDLRIVVPEALRVQFDWLGDDDPLQRAGAKPSREIKIGEVRDAIEWTQRSASSSRGRVLVIHPAEAINPSAANALLKTLEEPPGQLRIVMVGGDPERLLPTLRSRMQRLRLHAPAHAEALAWLQAQGVSHAARALAVAGGSPLGALSLHRAGFDERVLDDLPRIVARGDAQSLIGQPLPMVLDLLQRVAHDAMAHAAGATPVFFDSARMPAAAPLAELVQWERELLRVARDAEHPWHAPLLVEALVTKGARCWSVAAAPARRVGGHSLHSAG